MNKLVLGVQNRYSLQDNIVLMEELSSPIDFRT